MTRNTLGDVHNLLMAELERLDDESLAPEDLAAEIERARAITEVAAQVNANVANVVRCAQLKAKFGEDMQLPSMLGGGGRG